jgi:hypothetical protein
MTNFTLQDLALSHDVTPTANGWHARGAGDEAGMHPATQHFRTRGWQEGQTQLLLRSLLD